MSGEDFPFRIQQCVVAFLPFGAVYLGLAFVLDRFTSIPWFVIIWTSLAAYVATGAVLLALAIAPLVVVPKLRVSATVVALLVVVTALGATVFERMRS